jgi:twitching motility two-component system response regulator PilG
MPKKEILVVEDEESLLKLQSILLISQGYTVNGVANGQDALARIASYKPDLVLLDIMLPGLNGFEICQRIKSNEATRHIPVIMVTAKKSSEDMAKAEQAGADSYITKPFQAAVYMKTVKSFLSETARPAYSSF